MEATVSKRDLADRKAGMYYCNVESIIYCSTYLLLISEENPKPKPEPYTAAHGKLNPNMFFLLLSLQLLVALDALKGLSILHTDIKPDNIMFANKRDQPLRIKLIDFGEAIPASKVQPGMELQPIGYRWVHPAQLIC